MGNQVKGYQKRWQEPSFLGFTKKEIPMILLIIALLFAIFGLDWNWVLGQRLK